MVEYPLTEQQKMLKDLCREIAESKIRPLSRELDEKEEFSFEIMKVLAQSDLFALCIPEEYGGVGGGLLDLCIATEEISRVDGGVASSYAASFLGMFPILLFGTEEQKKKYLPLIASGKKLTAFALTEPEAGSDASNVKTTATKKNDSYILNGTKHFITNGGEAEIYTVIAVTDKTKGARGISAFIVEHPTAGFSFGKKEEKMGIRTSSTRELIFNEDKTYTFNITLKDKGKLSYRGKWKLEDQNKLLLLILERKQRAFEGDWKDAEANEGGYFRFLNTDYKSALINITNLSWYPPAISEDLNNYWEKEE
ncbi:MAG: acyl-CoA dehydrogenase family protein, partial [Candidatus Omnitrophica bacterium]|nr:acyl-CoA dehydrogenase family protein [Candidatus Omnitrophota bacterium]